MLFSKKSLTKSSNAVFDEKFDEKFKCCFRRRMLFSTTSSNAVFNEKFEEKFESCFR